MKIILSYIILTIFFNSDPQWTNNWQQAQEVSRNENKLILLNFSGSDWCAPCILLKREVFANEDFRRLAQEGLVLMRADFPRKKKNQLAPDDKLKNEYLAEKYNQAGKFPFTLLIDSSGKVLKSWDGYNGKSTAMINELKKSIHEN